MKSMVWTLENGRELRIESTGDEISITIPDARVTVQEVTADMGLVSMPDYTETGARVVLEVWKD